MATTKDRWDKAVVIGSIWASVEIILGSFLHNLRMPFSGSMLAMMAVILSTSFLLRWKTQGVIFRAALICALMKSVSPSAIILGPMTGILLEGILMELVFRLMGFNLVSALVAGVLAVSSALLHKVVNLLLIFGEDIIRIYVNIFQFAAKQLSYPEAGTLELLYILLAGYTFFGLLSGWMGYRVAQIRDPATATSVIKREWKKEHQKTPLPGLHTSWILLHAISLTGGLLLINFYGLQYFMVLMVPYLFLVALRYKHSIRKFRRASLWYQLLLMLVLAVVFYDIPSFGDHFFTLEGFYAGISLISRAIFVISVFTAISVELKNPAVEHFLGRMGFGHLHGRLRVAFDFLPRIIDEMPGIRNILFHPLRSLSHLNAVGERLIKEDLGEAQ